MTTLLGLLKYEIKHGTQRSVGALYACVYCVAGGADEATASAGEVNRAIIARWSFAGLDRVKKTAWKVAEDLSDGRTAEAR